jgi:hypothetical protein
MKRSSILLAIAVVIAATAGVATGKDRGKQVRYVGIHPIAKAHGSGLCHIEAPHVHVYGPANPVQYRDHGDDHYFVGDPVAYGWDGDKVAYYGHHPIYVDAVVDAGPVGDPVFCYLNGPHYHAFVPPTTLGVEWKLEGNAYFYIGTPPPVYVEARPALVKINAIYEPIEYVRPVVTVQPPAAWIGITFAMPGVAVVAPGAVVVDEPEVRGGVEVHVPAAVKVEVRPPSIEVGIGIGIGGGVVVGDGHHHHGGGKVKSKSKGRRGGGGDGKIILRPNRR